MTLDEATNFLIYSSGPDLRHSCVNNYRVKLTFQCKVYEPNIGNINGPEIPGMERTSTCIHWNVYVCHMHVEFQYSCKTDSQHWHRYDGSHCRAYFSFQHVYVHGMEHFELFTSLMKDRRVRPTVLLPVWHFIGYALGMVAPRLTEE